jgi:hypothetical protein
VLPQTPALKQEEIEPLLPAKLIVNMDECGRSDWEECKTKSVLIRQRAQNNVRHYAIDRQPRHQTMICCLIAAGDAYYRLLIPANPHVPQVFDTRVRDANELKIDMAPSPCTAHAIMRSMWTKFSFGRSAQARIPPDAPNRSAILFCDKCSPIVLKMVGQTWFDIIPARREMEPLSRRCIKNSETSNRHKKIMFTVIWGVDGFHIVDLRTWQRSFNSEYFVGHLDNCRVHLSKATEQFLTENHIGRVRSFCRLFVLEILFVF